jgi:hypothetical protein
MPLVSHTNPGSSPKGNSKPHQEYECYVREELQRLFGTSFAEQTISVGGPDDTENVKIDAFSADRGILVEVSFATKKPHGAQSKKWTDDTARLVLARSAIGSGVRDTFFVVAHKDALPTGWRSASMKAQGVTPMVIEPPCNLLEELRTLDGQYDDWKAP